MIMSTKGLQKNQPQGQKHKTLLRLKLKTENNKDNKDDTNSTGLKRK